MSYVLGVIGGSGLYGLRGLEDVTREAVTTPYGAPSSELVRGRLGETQLVFLSRHGAGHTAPPHQLNSRANICALKQAGVTHVVSLSAVGSLKEEIAPGHVVIVDQYIDLTKSRPTTFFEDGIAAHVGFADPACPHLSEAAHSAAQATGGIVHDRGTYVCIEGPQFSTRAESHLYRSWGASVIGMTAMPEAKLAREAELPYVTIAFATDYDCWHQTAEVVSVDAVLAVLKRNGDLAQRIIAEICSRLPNPAQSPASGALIGAVITDKDAFSSATRRKLDWLLAPYFKESSS